MPKVKGKINAPVSVLFCLLCVITLLWENYFDPEIIYKLFSLPSNWSASDQMSNNIRYVFHIFGHSDWSHLINNAFIILLIGPVVEEKIKPWPLVILIGAVAFLSGYVHLRFQPATLAEEGRVIWLLGASGVAYLFISLASFSNIKQGEFPLQIPIIIVLILVKDLLIERGANVEEARSLLSGGEIYTSYSSHIVGMAVGLVRNIFVFTLNKMGMGTKTQGAPSGAA